MLQWAVGLQQQRRPICQRSHHNVPQLVIGDPWYVSLNRKIYVVEGKGSESVQYLAYSGWSGVIWSTCVPVFVSSSRHCCKAVIPSVRVHSRKIPLGRTLSEEKWKFRWYVFW